jgi:hypothetical protein
MIAASTINILLGQIALIAVIATTPGLAYSLCEG